MLHAKKRIRVLEGLGTKSTIRSIKNCSANSTAKVVHAAGVNCFPSHDFIVRILPKRGRKRSIFASANSAARDENAPATTVFRGDGTATSPFGHFTCR